ncbi:MAG TPA: response regulator [Stenomitos sp.]
MSQILSQVESPKTIQILVVEDERIIALNLKESIESLGYAVPAIAASGEMAVEKAIEIRPDLVLMDIRLKGEMDGIEAARQIWEHLQIPVIYVTGHSDQSTLERAKITAPFGYILKPLKERELYVAIETALQRYEREQLLNAILRGMGDGVIVIDRERRVQFLNGVAQSLTGWSLAEARNRELTEVFNVVDEQTKNPVKDTITAALQEDIAVYLEENIVLISKEGKTIPIGNSAAPIKDNKGTITGVVLVVRDMTQRRLAEERNIAIAKARQLESQMAELQRINQLKDDFLNTVSHELRTPLSNIKMAVRLLEMVLNQKSLISSETLENSQAMTRYLKILEDQCNQELMLVNDLLDMRAIDADANPLELTPIHLQDWLPHIVESFQPRAQTQQQNLQLSFPPDLPSLVSDLSSLTRILSELINNACKYTPIGEQIIVTAQAIREDRTEQERQRIISSSSSTFSSLDAIQISVKNSGVKISPEELSRIFDPFYRIPNSDPWKYGGTGLGLALIKKLVHQLQGKIEVTSDQNWTAFTIVIPNLCSSP